MKSVSAKLPDWSARVILLILVLLPFHALLTVWIGGSLGVYEASRLWKEGLILALMPAAAYLLYKDKKLYRTFQSKPLFLLITAYVLLHLVLGLGALVRDEVTITAMWYALAVNLRFLGFFVICWIIGSKVKWLRERLPLAVLVPAAAVVLFGLLQVFVLPTDVLKHVGYGPETIAPYQTVDQKDDYLRVQSTLRGANPLGAYLVVIVSIVATGLLARLKDRRKLLTSGLFLVVSLIVLGFTYSRSAYIGAAIALGTVGWLLASAAVRRWILVGAAALIVIGAGLFTALQDNDRIQNIVFHTDETSQAKDSSNETRLNAQKAALEEVFHEPLGRGPGTAGPASQHNDGHPTRISENYFLQIGQETGWLGLGLFIGIVVLVAKELWQRRRVALLASLFGITFIALVSHAWADDTLSLLWWGAAGMLLAPAILNKSKNNEAR